MTLKQNPGTKRVKKKKNVKDKHTLRLDEDERDVIMVASFRRLSLICPLQFTLDSKLHLGRDSACYSRETTALCIVVFKDELQLIFKYIRTVFGYLISHWCHLNICRHTCAISQPIHGSVYSLRNLCYYLLLGHLAGKEPVGVRHGGYLQLDWRHLGFNYNLLTGSQTP